VIDPVVPSGALVAVPSTVPADRDVSIVCSVSHPNDAVVKPDDANATPQPDVVEAFHKQMRSMNVTDSAQRVDQLIGNLHDLATYYEGLLSMKQFYADTCLTSISTGVACKRRVDNF